MRKLPLLIFLIISTVNILAQSDNALSIEQEYLIRGQIIRDYLENTIKYPQSSIEKKSIGISVSKIDVTPNGRVENIQLLNTVDNDIDFEVIIALNSVFEYLIADSIFLENREYYFQIIFDIGDNITLLDNGNNIHHKKFMDPIVIKPDKKVQDNTPIIPDEIYLDLFTKFCAEEKYPEAIETATKLIARNPFNPKLYQLRAYANHKSGNKSHYMEDLKLINSFADGKSLEGLINKYYNFLGIEICKNKYDSITLPDNMEIFNPPEIVMPSFKGGDLIKFRDWVQRNVKYPHGAAAEGIQGKVLLMFVIDTNGKVVDVSVIKGCHTSLDNAALKVVRSSPDWTVGIKDGAPIAVRFTITVNFQLQ